RVRTRCTNGFYSLYKTSDYFQTPYAPCPAPTVFTVSNITENSATFTWSPADAFEYRIVLTDQNGVVYMREGIVGGSVTFTGLPSGTRFTPRITAICIGNQESRTFDDFVTLGTLPCNPPNPLNIQSVYSNAVEISWTPPQFYALGYEIEIRTLAGTPIETRSLDGGNFSSYTWVGLNPLTGYRIAVRTVCANGVSAYVVSEAFTTPAATGCGTPQNVQISNVRYTGATISWNAVPGASFYEIRLVGETGTGASGFFSTSNTVFELDELSPGSRARVIIIAYCNGQPSGLAMSEIIVTPGYCFAPTYTTATEISPTHARIVWTVVQGAIEYVLEYRRQGVSQWTTIVTGNSGFYELTGLLPETDYQYRISTICNGNTEDYIYGSFSTPPIPVYIWPGDANNDGVVDPIDLYVVCSAYGVGGPGRHPSQNGILWQGYLSSGPWTTSTIYRGQILNNRFLDCNGDGLIDLFDVAAAIVNRGRTH
ncbi:MAG: fibronectin type III domain-containing protein, partial [Bacteroidia bacterium]|nr:fibronectin type III domain-containing protein [Bacteroidia bacterium]